MIRVAAVGDLMVGDSATAVGFGVRSRFPGMKLSEALLDLGPRLRAADLAIGNLECPLAPVGVGQSRWARDQMRGDPEYAQVLSEAGFSVISVANNHAVQHGEAGFVATVEALRGQGIFVIGVRGSPPWQTEPVTYRHSSGTNVALLAYSWRGRQYGHGRPPYAEVDPLPVLADVTRARENHSHVIVSLHWGEEFVSQPSQAEVRFAQALAGKGADLVIGHHPHVIRPVERNPESVIAYSLGNAVTDMIWMETLRRGLLLEAGLGQDAIQVRLTEIRADESYHARLGPEVDQAAAALVVPHDAESYSTACAAGIRDQRLAAYRYTIRNLHRFPVSVLLSLVRTTAINKLSALLGHNVGGWR